MVYVLDGLDIARRATVEHLPPQAFASASMLYLFAALQTLAHPGSGRQERVVAGALALTLVLLALTAILGFLFTLALGRRILPGVLRLAPAHALLGLVGWLTILVTGISTRTFGPIFGAKSRFVAAHIVVGAALAAGTIVAAVAIPLDSRLLLDCGLIVIGIGTQISITDGVSAMYFRRCSACEFRPSQRRMRTAPSRSISVRRSRTRARR
ncbi:MAG: hypothetical protein ABSB70_19815 [Candidatus Velthaea sp.]